MTAVINERSLDELTATFVAMGTRLAQCDCRCMGVACDPATGYLPRCLVFEPRSGDLRSGVIVVGVNPGHANASEREQVSKLFAAGHDPKAAFADYLALITAEMRRIPFYTLMRAAVDALGFHGPILWTELVKCETGEPIQRPDKAKGLTFHIGPAFATTVGTCRDKFLQAELDVAPGDWPIIAAGLGVGDYLESARTQMNCARAIVAVPHPTGRPEFLERFVPARLELDQKRRIEIEETIKNKGFLRL